MGNTVLAAAGQLALVLFLAPLVQGIIKRAKGRLQGRRGPGIGQPYADLRKLLLKEMVLPETATWLFWAAPYVYFAAILAAALLVPMALAAAPLGFGGDAILLIYLLALGRFALALATLESGSAFAGMGSSREMALGALVEPALLLTLATFFLRTGSTGLGDVAGALSAAGWSGVTLPHLLGLLALLVVAVAETGRVPVDNPDTHLELTMIHEGMLLEYSGPLLALITWAAQAKQFLVLALAANLALPWGLPAVPGPGPAGALALTAASGAGLLLVKVVALGLLLAAIETVSAKIRILRLPEFLGTAVLLAGLAVLIQWGMGG